MRSHILLSLSIMAILSLIISGCKKKTDSSNEDADRAKPRAIVVSSDVNESRSQRPSVKLETNPPSIIANKNISSASKDDLENQSTFTEDSERISLSRSDWDIVANLDVQVPPDTIGHLTDGPIGETPIIYDPPVHPIGHIRSLSINGKQVEIDNTELNDGMLRTKIFGNIEFILFSTKKVEIRATKAQINKIEIWLPNAP